MAGQQALVRTTAVDAHGGRSAFTARASVATGAAVARIRAQIRLAAIARFAITVAASGRAHQARHVGCFGAGFAWAAQSVGLRRSAGDDGKNRGDYGETHVGWTAIQGGALGSWAIRPSS